MTTKTLKWVDPEPKPWESKFGPMVSIDLEFEDGVKGRLNTKPDSFDKRFAELQAVIGKPGEYTIEETGNWPDGNPKPVKVKDYPGKPQQGTGGGGGGGYKGFSFAERLHLDTFKEASTDARTALMQSVTLLNFQGTYAGIDDVLVTASRIYAWLQEKKSGADSTPGANSPSPAPDTGREGSSSLSPPAPNSSPPIGGAEGTSAGAAVPSGERGSELLGEGASDPAHTHSWKPSPRPNMAAKGWQVCECGETQHP